MQTSTCLNAAAPLLLPIRQNPTSVGGMGSVRGIPITLSDPSQFFSFQPNVNQNNTFVYNHCDTTNYTCIAEHGGVYSPPASAPRAISYNSWNGTAGEDVQNGSYVFFNDLMTVEGHKIYGYPFFTYQETAGQSSVLPSLGLGRNSTFLEAAADLKIIPSKQWSYWGGDRLTGVEGHLLVGAYDKNRVQGDFTTFAIDPRRTLSITIHDISWVTSNGNKTSLLDGTSYVELYASINPFPDYIALPSEVRNNFRYATGAYIDSGTQYLAYNTRPSGNLVITLSNNKVISLPSSVLFDHGLTYDSQGNANTNAYDFWTPKVYGSTTYGQYTLNFGAPFLAQQYLVTDWDSMQYYLADAVQGTGSPVNMQPLCTGGSQSDPTPGSKTNVGAIAGGVVGGVVALLLVGLLAFFLIRRRNNAKKEAAAADGLEVNKPMEQHQPHQPPPPPPQYASGVPSSVPTTGTVYAEKDGGPTSAHTATPDTKHGFTQPQSIGELPSPTTTFSRSSQGFAEQHQQKDEQSQAYIEMPADSIGPRRG